MVFNARWVIFAVYVVWLKPACRFNEAIRHPGSYLAGFMS